MTFETSDRQLRYRSRGLLRGETSVPYATSVRSSMPRDLGVLTQARAGDEGSTLTGQLVALFAVAVGIIILNVFAPQILVGQIAPELGLAAAAAGLVAMMTVLGYAAGLVFSHPLATRVRNRRLGLFFLCIPPAPPGA